jgi:hypothetical protein
MCLFVQCNCVLQSFTLQLTQDAQAAKRRHEAGAIQWHDDVKELRQHHTALQASHDEFEKQLTAVQQVTTSQLR